MEPYRRWQLFEIVFAISFWKWIKMKLKLTTNEKVKAVLFHIIFFAGCRAHYVNNIKNCAKFDKFNLTRSFLSFWLSEVLNEFFTHNFYAKDFAPLRNKNSGHKFSVCMLPNSFSTSFFLHFQQHKKLARLQIPWITFSSNIYTYFNSRFHSVSI